MDAEIVTFDTEEEYNAAMTDGTAVNFKEVEIKPILVPEHCAYMALVHQRAAELRKAGIRDASELYAKLWENSYLKKEERLWAWMRMRPRSFLLVIQDYVTTDVLRDIILNTSATNKPGMRQEDVERLLNELDDKLRAYKAVEHK